MTDLPLFPLRTVLFPGGLLPLRIFEPRYIDMVGRCLREDQVFGVVLILEGEEGGMVDRLAAVGCSARIVDFQQLPDGLLGLMCRGERRFRIHSRGIQAGGLHTAEVGWLPEPPPIPLTADQAPLSGVLRRVLVELGDLAQHLRPDYEEAGWVSNRFAELLPLDRATQQKLLEIDDPRERLRLLSPLITTSREP